MTITETNRIMERIKQHYQEFVIDEYKVEEWHQELEKYDFEDVNKKLEEHLRSEQYGNSVPKLYFLTKYLTPTEEKGKIKKYIVKCQLCGKEISQLDYEKHYDKCSSIDYLIRNFKRFKNKDITREQLENLTEEKFNQIYWKLIEDNLENPILGELEKRSMKIAYQTFMFRTKAPIETILKDI